MPVITNVAADVVVIVLVVAADKCWEPAAIISA